MKTINVLMVCTGNICRSPMAAALLRSNLPEEMQRRVQIASAGTHAMRGLPAEPFAVALMTESGLDIRTHRSRPLDAALIDWADRMAVMEEYHGAYIRRQWPTAAEKVRLLGRYSETHPSQDIPDPYGGSLAEYRASAARIHACLEGLTADLGVMMD